MKDEPIVEHVGSQLLQKLRQALCPNVLTSPDEAMLSAPGGARQDYRFGIFLYDIQDSSPFGAAIPVRISASERRLPPKTVELRYLLYVNHSVPFDGMGAEEEARLLEAAMRAIHDGMRFDAGIQEAAIGFDNLTLSEKSTLWQSLNCPIQPAIYVYAAPICIPSGRILNATPVRTIHYQVRKKEADS